MCFITVDQAQDCRRFGGDTGQAGWPKRQRFRQQLDFISSKQGKFHS
jgi:hypothetical protein